MNINNIESYDYFYIIDLCRTSKFDELRRIIVDNNIDINDYYFLRDITTMNNTDLIDYLIEYLKVDFRMNDYQIFQYLAFIGYVDILEYLINKYDCFDYFYSIIKYSSLHNKQITLNYFYSNI